MGRPLGEIMIYISATNRTLTIALSIPDTVIITQTIQRAKQRHMKSLLEAKAHPLKQNNMKYIGSSSKAEIYVFPFI
jgi:hypothetical protein